MIRSSPADLELINVRVLLFSVLREHVGRSTIDLEMDARSDVRDLVDHLADRFAGVAAYRHTIRVAVNQEYVDEEHALSTGDEVALITPVSGG